VLGLLAASGAKAALTQLQIGYYTDYPVQISYAGGSQMESVYATAFSARAFGTNPLPPDQQNPFTAFCIDIASPMSSPGYWQSGALPLGDNGNRLGWTPGGISRAASLYDHYSTAVDFTSASGERTGAALQLAIWEVLYENSGAFNGRTGSGFHATGSCSILDIANTMLASRWNRVDDASKESFWNAVNPDGTSRLCQDLIGPPLPTGFAPEPGMGFASGCAGVLLLVAGMRRSSAA